MKTIDVRGKLCPEPLIITKRAIKGAVAGDSFNVLLDNDIATCNLENFLLEMKIESVTVREGENATLSFTLGESPKAIPAVEDFCEIATPRGDYAVVISSNGMGKDADGTNTLGKTLMRGYINALAEQDMLPKTIIMYNSGVVFACEGADTVESLKRLSVDGVDIILCGVCADYYEIKDKIAVGRISNMFEITKITSTVGHVVYP